MLAVFVAIAAMSFAVVRAAVGVEIKAPTSSVDEAAAPNQVCVPVSDRSSWRLLAFDHVPQHAVRFSPGGLDIAVRSSAMPLLCRLEQTIRASSIHVRGRISGKLQVLPEKQGQKGHDDYTLRVGLVELGPNPIGARQLKSSPNWVKALSDCAPPGSGIAKVHFLNLAVDRSEIGRKRQHPLSKLLEEEIVAVPRSDGSFDFTHAIEPAADTCAVWISTDGDDTKSSFEVTIERIEFDLASSDPRPGRAGLNQTDNNKPITHETHPN
jgi:hypothetical protein